MVSPYSVNEVLELTGIHHDALPLLPRVIDLDGEPLTLRRMTAAYADHVHRFFRSLPSADLLVLRRDVTDGRHIDDWVAEVERGETVTILAEAGGTVLGEATLHLTDVPWSRHVGVVRVFVAYEQRGRGLGERLLEEVCRLAPGLQVQRLVAEMTVEQTAALRLLARLGFEEEARLRNHVKDRHGCPHDLVIMARDLIDFDDLRAQVCAPRPSVWRCTTCGFVARAWEGPDCCPDCGAAGGFLVPTSEM